jgi:ABC-type antimicrobial peptide transport system permease subunit
MGIYGTVSYVVLHRTREIGIRIALGARARDVLRLILSQSARPVVAGLMLGLMLAVGATYVLRGVLYGLRVLDGVSFVRVSLLLMAVALVAAYVPARRASAVDPAVALRFE